MCSKNWAEINTRYLIHLKDWKLYTWISAVQVLDKICPPSSTVAYPLDQVWSILPALELLRLFMPQAFCQRREQSRESNSNSGIMDQIIDLPIHKLNHHGQWESGKSQTSYNKRTASHSNLAWLCSCTCRLLLARNLQNYSSQNRYVIYWSVLKREAWPFSRALLALSFPVPVHQFYLSERFQDSQLCH